MLSTIVLAAIVAGAVSLIAIGILFEINSRQKNAPAPVDSSLAKSSGIPTNWWPLLFLVVLAVGVIAFALYLQAREKAIINTYGEDIASLCPNSSFDPADEQRYLETRVRPYQIVILNLQGRRHDWHDNLPDELRADDRASLDLVACVGDKKYSQVIESCEYVEEFTNKIFTINRVQYYWNVYLLDPDTGQLAKTLRAWGSAPDYCPDQIYNKRPIEGDEPGFSYFYKVLVDYAWSD